MFAITCQSQNSTKKKELKPPFNNQGEQENYWAQELFKKEYKKTTYEVYTNDIKKVGTTDFVYNNMTFHIYGVHKTLESIFTKGILYPQLINGYELAPKKSAKELDSLSKAQRYLYEMYRGDNLIVTNLEELKFLSNSPKVKRFRFWLNRPKMANSQVYLFELTNEKATKKTTFEEFLKNAKLTFFKAGWIVI